MDSLEQARKAADAEGLGSTRAMERAKLLVLADIAESLRVIAARSPQYQREWVDPNQPVLPGFDFGRPLGGDDRG